MQEGVINALSLHISAGLLDAQWLNERAGHELLNPPICICQIITSIHRDSKGFLKFFVRNVFHIVTPLHRFYLHHIHD
jgi:hypothetical protein